MENTSLIPSGDAIKGKPLFLSINAKQKIGFADQIVRFGALLAHETKVGDRSFPLTGWLGPQGQSVPVVAEYTENPQPGESGKDRPSVRMFNELNGTLVEIAVAFKRHTADKRVFHSGNSATSPKFEITLNHKHEGEDESHE